MIEYDPGNYHFTFIFTRRGSVLPRAMAYAGPAGLLAIIMKAMGMEEHFSGVLTTSAAYSGFSFVVGFLLVFRTSQSYARFWDGATKVQQMKSKWCDAFSSLVAFSRNSKRSSEDVMKFQQTLLRLFSLLHSLALQQIHSMHGESFDIVDEFSLDDDSLDYLKEAPVTCRVEVVNAWIHQLIVDSIDSGLLPVPAPILSRVFQEMSNGSVNMDNACNLAHIPFPFPYAQMMTVLLLMHWFLTPVLMCMWTGHWFYSFVWTFVPVLSFWGINMIAAEIEQPFGDDVNDLPTHDLQRELNSTLILLVEPDLGRVPHLKSSAEMNVDILRERYCGVEVPVAGVGCDARDLERSKDKKKEVEPKQNLSQQKPGSVGRVDVDIADGLGNAFGVGEASGSVQKLQQIHDQTNLERNAESEDGDGCFKSVDNRSQQPRMPDARAASHKNTVKLSQSGYHMGDLLDAAESGANSSKGRVSTKERVIHDVRDDMDQLERENAKGDHHKVIMDELLLALLQRFGDVATLIGRSNDDRMTNQTCLIALVKDQLNALKDIASGQWKWTQALNDQLVMLTMNEQALPRLPTNIQGLSHAVPAGVSADAKRQVASSGLLVQAVPAAMSADAKRQAASSGLLTVPSTHDQDYPRAVAEEPPFQAPLVPSFSALSRCATVPETLRLPLWEPTSLPSLQSISDFGRNAQETLRSAQAPLCDAAAAQRQRLQALCQGASAAVLPQSMDLQPEPEAN